MELRLYSFVNFYLSSIQQGIQTGHAAVDLVRRYRADRIPAGAAWNKDVEDQIDMAVKWADDYKTFIILNGGDADGVIKALSVLSVSGFPYIEFHEGEEALHGIMTCCAVVLPESIFNARYREPDIMQSLRDLEPVYQYVDPETTQITAYYPGHKHYELIKLLKASKLAS